MIDRDEGAAGDSPDQTSSRTLSARIEELRKLVAAGDIRVSPGLADIASTRVIAELEMLLCADDELEAILHEARDIPAIHGSIARPAAVRELARRSHLSSHQRIAEFVERRKLKKC